MRCLLLACVCLWLPLRASALGGARPAGFLSDTLLLRAVNEGPWTRYFAYCFAPLAQPVTGEFAQGLHASGQFRPLPAGRVFQAGYTRDRLWLRAVVRNTLPQRTRFVWSLYEFVDSAALYVQPAGRGRVVRVAAASSYVEAAARPFPSRALCLPFWLEAGQCAVAYLRVDNFSGATYLPTDLTTAEDFLTYEASFFAFKRWAWLLGLYVGSALFNLILYAFLRDRIHLWYVAYVGFSGWFLLMEDGLDALLLPAGLYRLGWHLGQYSVLLLALGSGLRILSLFVRLRQGWPRLYRVGWALSGLAAAYALAYGALRGPALQAGAGALAALNGGREALLWGLLAAGAGGLAVVATRGRPVQRRLAALYALTYASFFLGCVNFLLNRTGIVNIHLLEPNALAWGLALELLALSALLTGRFRHALRQNAELRLRRLHEREAAGQRLMVAQDEERAALARELHDALAPGLTALHLAWQGRRVRQALADAPPALTEAHNQAEALLRQLRHDVRSLSQVLLPSPPGGEQPPLPEAVRLLVDTLRLADEGPHLRCHCDPAAAQLPVPVQVAAYRIVAELLHNALRHAQAQHIGVQVQCLPASLRLLVEDDGRGFDPAQPPSRHGLGLRGVRARASYLRGQVLVSSQPGRGVLVMVELPT